MINKITHSELVSAGLRWLVKTLGSRFAISELVCASDTGEIPDIIAWKSGYSILIECKTSRSDFFADSKKSFRVYPDTGMGQYRFYLCPDGLISKADLPRGWGLLYYSKNRKSLKRIVCFKKNIVLDSDNLFCQQNNLAAENALLVSYCSRMLKK